MSIYIGPCNYGTPEPDGEYLTADSSDEKTISVVGDLDMKRKRIVNLQEPREFSSDATTVGYVHRRVGILNNEKVDWTGGTMIGHLDMGNFKLKQNSNPEEDNDVINKRYFDSIVQETKPYDLGRYIVFPHADGTSTYHGAGARRNINIDSDKVFEIFNNNVQGSEIMIPRRLDSRGFQLTGKEKLITILRSEHNINPNPPPDVWTFLFSVQPANQETLTKNIYLFFTRSGVNKIMKIEYNLNKFKILINDQEKVIFDINTNKLNHFALEYNDNNLIVWANGVSRKTHTLDLSSLGGLRLPSNFYGVVSLYNRELSKLEIVEHYVKYHVKAFTNDEVL